MKAYFLLYFLLISFSLIVQAQQPSHYIIGEEKLSGIDIYSITQDDDANIWLSTNSGLIKYDGYNYHKIKTNKTKSNSLFGLTKDNFGEVYCCNLSGQIFKVKKDSLQLYYEIPDSLLSNLVHFNFDNKNRLVFCTKNYYLVDEKNKIKFLFPSKYGSNRIAKSKKDELVFIDLLSKQIAYYKNGKIALKEQLNFYANYPFTVQNSFFLTKSLQSQIYYKDGKGWNKINLENSRIFKENLVNFYPINDTLFVLAFTNKGICFYNKNGTLKYKRSKLFSKYKISGILNDKEGNIWLTTLGKGIIIIPNANMVDFNNHSLFREDDLKVITSDIEGNIYVGGLNGIIYKIKNQRVEIIKKQNIEIEFLNFNSKINAFFYQDGIIPLNKDKEKTHDFSAIKDICLIDSNHYYIATNKGLFSFILNKNNSYQIKPTFIKDIRVHCVAYHTKRKEIWTGTTRGLELISKSKKHILKYKEQQISVTDIAYINNEIWVSTSNNGILIFNEGKFSRLFSFTAKNKIESVYKLKYKDSKLYFTTEKGLCIYDFEHQSSKNISKTDGLLSNRVNNFEVIDDKIWLLFAGVLQCIYPNKIVKNKTPPIIKWKNILANNKQILNSILNEFKYNLNQFEFQFIATAFKHRGELKYQYKLSGLDNEWHELLYKNNLVRFQSLPHGNYIFNIKAINENGIESNLLTYSFSITPPFWITWWFYLLCGLGLILIVVIFFLIRLNIVRKRLTLEKQLKTYEITAIKSQMNPHFVFNALNSIQDLIMLKDIRSSSLYLGKFANLMRKTLEFSSKNLITLLDEIEILKLYLELEKLRFGDEFKATINSNLTAEKLQEIHIPSMLLQPYVENAIKHGLLHKKGNKELIINFCLKDKTLICEIIDNGVGRKKSKEIKQRREKSYPSFSTEANKKRIDLIRESTNKDISLNIIDFEKNGISTGTKVVFEFS